LPPRERPILVVVPTLPPTPRQSGWVLRTRARADAAGPKTSAAAPRSSPRSALPRR